MAGSNAGAPSAPDALRADGVTDRRAGSLHGVGERDSLSWAQPVLSSSQGRSDRRAQHRLGGQRGEPVLGGRLTVEPGTNVQHHPRQRDTRVGLDERPRAAGVDRRDGRRHGGRRCRERDGERGGREHPDHAAFPERFTWVTTAGARPRYVAMVRATVSGVSFAARVK